MELCHCRCDANLRTCRGISLWVCSSKDVAFTVHNSLSTRRRSKVLLCVVVGASSRDWLVQLQEVKSARAAKWRVRTSPTSSHSAECAASSLASHAPPTTVPCHFPQALPAP